MTNESELRIGDAEREAAASALGEHFASGRVTREEYDERSDRVWAARTNSDLTPLLVDLPSLGGPPPQPGRAHRNPRGLAQSPGTQDVSRRGSPRSGFHIPWLPLILLVVGLSFWLPGPWWLLLLAALFLSRSFGHRRSTHGCGGHLSR